MNYGGPRVTPGWVLKCGEHYGLASDESCKLWPVNSRVIATVFRRKQEALGAELGDDGEWRIVRLFRRVRGTRGVGT